MCRVEELKCRELDDHGRERCNTRIFWSHLSDHFTPSDVDIWTDYRIQYIATYTRVMLQSARTRTRSENSTFSTLQQIKWEQRWTSILNLSTGFIFSLSAVISELMCSCRISIKLLSVCPKGWQGNDGLSLRALSNISVFGRRRQAGY